MKSCVIVFPGSNCERDMKIALRDISGSEPEMVWHADSDFQNVDLIVLPGGFSYGDYLRCGAMASKSKIMKEVVGRAKKGVPILGVCNGFQILVESGLLPGTLIRNSGIKYVCKDVNLTVESNDTIFTNNYSFNDVIRIPIAHRDGNYFAENSIIKRLEDETRIAFRYADKDGNHTKEANPNGSQKNIAGIYNKAKSILGMMPHPERFSDPLLGGCDGKLLFEGLVNAFS